ncbi:hypothetical protein HDU93_001466 [Gonapodya sp. JEL0774]|nr:hypothetical protein HDU93_001466 [Gonapodya sp. JEL0774]
MFAVGWDDDRRGSLASAMSSTEHPAGNSLRDQTGSPATDNGPNDEIVGVAADGVSVVLMVQDVDENAGTGSNEYRFGELVDEDAGEGMADDKV